VSLLEYKFLLKKLLIKSEIRIQTKSKAFKNSFFGINVDLSRYFHLLATYFLAKSNMECWWTMKLRRGKLKSCHYLKQCLFVFNWKLFLIWLIGFGDFLAIISCKKAANGYTVQKWSYNPKKFMYLRKSVNSRMLSVQSSFL